MQNIPLVKARWIYEGLMRIRQLIQETQHAYPKRLSDSHSRAGHVLLASHCRPPSKHTPSSVPLINWSNEWNLHKTSARGRTEFDISVCLFYQNTLQRWSSLLCVSHDPQRHSVRITKHSAWSQRDINGSTALIIRKIYGEFISCQSGCVMKCYTVLCGRFAQ